MKLGCFNLPPFCKSVEDAIDLSVEQGLGSLELSYGMFKHFSSKEDAFARAGEIKAYADARGVALRCFSCGADFTWDAREKIDQLKLYADICRITDCKLLHHTVVDCLDINKRMPLDEALPRIIPACREVFDYAASVGVQCVYEPQAYVMNGAKNLLRFFDALDREALLVADLGNTLFVNESPAELIKAFRGRIAHVHLKDCGFAGRLNEIALPYAFGNSKERAAAFYRNCCHETLDGQYVFAVPAGEGVNDFVALFVLLLEQGYDGVFHLEHAFWSEDPREELNACIAFYNRCYKEAKRIVEAK